MNAPAQNSARKVKIVATLCIVIGLIAWIAGFAVEADAAILLGSLGFFGGLIAFVVGRFME